MTITSFSTRLSFLRFAEIGCILGGRVCGRSAIGEMGVCWLVLSRGRIVGFELFSSPFTVISLGLVKKALIFV